MEEPSNDWPEAAEDQSGTFLRPTSRRARSLERSGIDTARGGNPLDKIERDQISTLRFLRFDFGLGHRPMNARAFPGSWVSPMLMMSEVTTPKSVAKYATAPGQRSPEGSAHWRAPALFPHRHEPLHSFGQRESRLSGRLWVDIMSTDEARCRHISTLMARLLLS